MARPFLTLLLLQHGELVRAEFARAQPPRLTSLQRMPRAAHSSLAEQIESEQIPGGTLRGDVWILSDEIFTQTIDVDARSVRGLADVETTQALAFEVQLLSGFNASESSLGWRSLPSTAATRSYWVTQVPHSEQQPLDDAVHAQGARLIGIAHPAGLPTRLAPVTRADGTWKRIESWHDLAAEIETNAEGGTSLRMRRTDPGRWRRDAAGVEPHTEALLAHGGAQVPRVSDEPFFDLDDDTALGTWLAAWAAALTDDAELVPVIRVPRRATSTRTLVIAGLALALVVGASIAWYDAAVRTQRDELRAELVSVAQPVERAAAAAKERRELEAKVAALRAAEERGRVVSTPCTWTSDTPERWMRALAEERPEGLAVDQFDITTRRSTVRGVCLEAHLVDTYVASLARALEASGCRVTPTLKRLEQGTSSAALYEFEIEIAAPHVAVIVTSESE